MRYCHEHYTFQLGKNPILSQQSNYFVCYSSSDLPGNENLLQDWNWNQRLVGNNGWVPQAHHWSWTAQEEEAEPAAGVDVEPDPWPHFAGIPAAAKSAGEAARARENGTRRPHNSWFGSWYSVGKLLQENILMLWSADLYYEWFYHSPKDHIT